jgi:N-acetyl-anhydromuramyl-L-alanine amidase AmpD
MTPRPEVRHLSRNQSSRNGVKPLLIVLHSTESRNQPGLSDLRAIGNWFDTASAQVSAHTCNDAQGNDARYVPDSRKAWACAGYNSLSLNHEQIGAAAQTQWPEAQLRNTADWIAYWSKLHGIPIQRGRVGNGQVIKPGVVMHSELGAIGGGHHDPGPAYPIDQVLEYAINATPDARKQKLWKAHLGTARVQLKSLLAIRARMRQNHLEQDVPYAPTTQQLNALRQTIRNLKRLIR